jgi:hypothetical protein
MKTLLLSIMGAIIAQSASAGVILHTISTRPLPAREDQMICSYDRYARKETCETNEYLIEIYSGREVDLTWKATPGTTGYTATLQLNNSIQKEGPFSEEVYTSRDTRWRVEVGHTDGTQIFIRIDNKTESFFHEVAIP